VGLDPKARFSGFQSPSNAQFAEECQSIPSKMIAFLPANPPPKSRGIGRQEVLALWQSGRAAA
jgi:hypothetical protein